MKELTKNEAWCRNCDLRIVRRGHKCVICRQAGYTIFEIIWAIGAVCALGVGVYVTYLLITILQKYAG